MNGIAIFKKLSQLNNITSFMINKWFILWLNKFCNMKYIAFVSFSLQFILTLVILSVIPKWSTEMSNDIFYCVRAQNK